MSILGEHAGAILLLCVLLVISGVLAAATGVFRPGALSTAWRIPLGRSLWEIVFVIALGVFIDLLVPAAFAQIKLASQPRSATTQPFESLLTSWDWAFLATVPQLCALAVLLAGDWAVGGTELIRGLGLSAQRLPIGVGTGLIAGLIVLPPVYCIVSFISWVYDKVHYSHPEEHELLRVMGEAHHGPARIILILGAVVAAPLFEEYLFRGHIQTLIRTAILRLRRKTAPPPPTPSSANPGTQPAVPVLPYEPDAAVLASAPALPTWTAIVATSALFALVHPLWMAPPIFCLAIGLGYAYERTGNLWTSITLHMLFNGISTAAYLAGAH